MESYFWNGDKLDDFLFKGLNTKSWAGLTGVCIAIVSIAVLYEGLHLLKQYFLSRFIKVRKEIRTKFYNKTPASDQHGTSTGANAPSSPRRRQNGNDIGSGESAPRSLLEETDCHNDHSTRIRKPPGLCSYQSGIMDLGISSILHSIYVFVGFTLMNAVMTFNIWVLVSVCIGVAIGYFSFGNYRRVDNLMHPPYGTETTSLNESENTSPVGDVFVGAGDNSNSGYTSNPTFRIPEGDSNQEPCESARLIDVGAEVHTPRIMSSSVSST